MGSQDSAPGASSGMLPSSSRLPTLIAVVLVLFFLLLQSAARYTGTPFDPSLQSPAPFDSSLVSPQSARAHAAQLCACSQKLVLDYFEIGTSDFNTMLQAAETAMKAGGPPQRGVSVDAIHVYISRLPEVPGLARVHSAVVGWEPHNETVVTWFVDPQDLWDNWDATHVPPWLRGCNTVGRPFKTVIDELSRLNLMHIYRTQQVPALSVREIMLAHEGCRIKLLKIDTEGFDTILLVGYSDFLWAHPECHADKIQFETMHSTPAQIAGAQEALALSGYTQCGYDVDAGGGAPDSILCYSPYKDARLQWAARAQRGGGATHTEAEVWGMLAGGAEAVEAALEGSLEELQEAAERRQCGTCPWVS